VFSVKYIRVKE